MARDNYDDMQDNNYGERKRSSDNASGNRKIVLGVVLLGIATCVVCVLIGWNKFFPPEPAAPTVPVVNVVPQASREVEKVSDAPVVTAPEPTVVDVQPKKEVPKAETKQDSNTAVRLSEAQKVEVSKKMVQFIDHPMAENETLQTVADSYGLKVQTLVSVNQIRNVNAIQKGTVIRIPDRDGQYYTVKDGDMLSTIARSYNMGWKTLMEINGLTNEMIKPGQQLFVPDSTSSASTKNADVAPISFIKPSEGKIIGKFGFESDDPADEGTYDGILIQGKSGEAVKAAADGDVVDAGYEQVGRGRFVVISHQDGYRTTYTHLENVDIRSGNKVSKGQVIGSMGTSGTKYEQAVLYFSIEQNGISLNPADFF